MSTATGAADALQLRLERMLARDEIREVLARYARGVDRADADLLKSCYHPDAIEEHGGNYTGNAFAYVDGAVPRIRLMGAMQHLLGTSHIEFDGDVAWVETYLWTFARFAANGKSTDTFTGGRLVDRFERRAGRLEDRPSTHGVRLEPRYAVERRLVHRPVRSGQAGHAPRSQEPERPFVRPVLSIHEPGQGTVSRHLLPAVRHARRTARRRHARRRAGH